LRGVWLLDFAGRSIDTVGFELSWSGPGAALALPMAPIHDAAFRGDIETLRRLLAEGVSPDATDSLDRTPLHRLCRSSEHATGDLAACFKLLRDAGANLEAVDCHRWTPLHRAAFKSADCVEVLLAAGASVNARSNSGRTPFDLALSQNYRRTWPLFLRAGAEIPTDNTDRYIVRVRNAGGFQRYAQAHLARLTRSFEPKFPMLPKELVRHVVSFWLHAGYY
jgi:ankyrin repeat protein